MKQQVSLWKLGLAVCVLLALVWIGWRIIAQTAAQNLAATDPAAALGWYPHESSALNQLAEQELSKPTGNLDAAREWAQRALRANPLDAHALALLGLIADRKGDQKGAETLMRMAGARTWRDRTSQSWLFDSNVRKGDYVHALPHLDAILRVNLDAEAELFPVLAALTVTPAAFKALTEFLATSPPWRTWFLGGISNRLANQARLIELYAELKKSPAPPTIEELKPYLDRLIRDGDFKLAYRTWRDTLPPKQSSDDVFPFNRDFALPLDGLPFNWQIIPIAGADAQIASEPDDEKKRALRVQFSGARVAFANVRQLMMLPEGGYRLSGQMKAERLQTPRGLWWRVFCADKSGSTLAHTDLALGTVGWTDFAAEFQVPAAGCKAQWLQLELPARIPSESEIDGQVWYQDIRIAQTALNSTPSK